MKHFPNLTRLPALVLLPLLLGSCFGVGHPDYKVTSARVGGPRVTKSGPWLLDSAISIEVFNVGAEVNNAGEQYAPAISSDGSTLYFVATSRDVGATIIDSTYGEMGQREGNHDVWVALRADDTALHFSRPHNLGAPVNSTLDEGALAFNGASREIYFTACNRQGGVGDCDIFLWDGGASLPQSIVQINSPYWETQPTVSRDGGTIIFVSNRAGARQPPGGPNGPATDLYVARKTPGGSWGRPEMIRELSTTSRDESPALAGGDSLLFFSSTRRGGYGGFDLYVSRLRADGRWGPPENLGPTINTPASERFISVQPDGSMIYFASSRRDLPNAGGLDIFAARLRRK